MQVSNLLPEIGITPDGTTAWITNTASNTISSVVGLNTPTPTFGSSIVVVNGPNGIAITSDGKQAFVSNATSVKSVVTFATATVVNIPTGSVLTDPAISPDQAPVAYFTLLVAPAG